MLEKPTHSKFDQSPRWRQSRGNQKNMEERIYGTEVSWVWCWRLRKW